MKDFDTRIWNSIFCSAGYDLNEYVKSRKDKQKNKVWISLEKKPV